MQYTSTSLLNAVLAALSNCSITQDGSLWIVSGLPQMSRPEYKQFKVVMAAGGGTWQKGKKQHVFYRNPIDTFQEIVKAGKLPHLNPFALFETPEATVSELLEYINFPCGEWTTDYPFRILEPNAGRGAIARKIREFLPHAQITCVEIDPINVQVLRDQGFDVIEGDFLSLNIENNFDYVVMNPPFKGTEYLKHIQKAFDLLKINGVLGAIAPTSGLMTRSSSQALALRNLIASQGRTESIGSVFETTSVECSIIKIEKLSKAAQQDLFNSCNGYANQFVYDILIALNCDRDWDRLINTYDGNKQKVTEYLDSWISGQLCQKELFFYDKDIREQLIKEFLALVQENSEEIIPFTPVQTSLALA